METEQRENVTVYLVLWGKIVKGIAKHVIGSNYSGITDRRGGVLWSIGHDIAETFEDAKARAVSRLRHGIEQDTEVITKLEAAIVETARLIEKMEALQESDV